MENSEQEQVSRWVSGQAAHLDPPPNWQPNHPAALARFREQVRARRPLSFWAGWPAWTALAAMTLILLWFTPGTRARAQQLWQSLRVGRVAFVRVSAWPEGVRSPDVKLIGTIIPPIPSRNVEQVRSRVQYEPRLPRLGVLSDAPRLSTTFSLSAGMVVHSEDLKLALRKVGVIDQTVPPQWDGARLVLHTSNIVIAEWPDLMLAQSLPLTLTAPPGFDFRAFSTLVLRILGVGPGEAQRLAARAGTTPLWLAPMDERDGTLEELQLQSGPAILFRQRVQGGDSTGRIAIAWSVSDRVFALTGTLSREMMIATANAIP